MRALSFSQVWAVLGVTPKYSAISCQVVNSSPSSDSFTLELPFRAGRAPVQLHFCTRSRFLHPSINLVFRNSSLNYAPFRMTRYGNPLTIEVGGGAGISSCASDFEPKENWMARVTYLTISFVLMGVFTAPTSASAQQTEGGTDVSRIADAIIVGLLSEEEFHTLVQTHRERLEVFKAIREARGWSIGDEELSRNLSIQQQEGSNSSFGKPGQFTLSASPAARYVTGSDHQYIAMEAGNSAASYPTARVKPNAGECGTDSDDIVLIYNTPKWPSTDTTKVRSWSNLWWVRAVMRSSYTSGGMAAHGLAGPVARACIGSKAKWLGPDLNYLYIWHK